MSGQINRGTFFGDQIYSLSFNNNFKNYVEVGTWNGQGSTKCFMDALLQRNDESTLYSLEANAEFYNQAKRYWDPLVLTVRTITPKLHLLYGRIIEAGELVSAEEVLTHSRFHQHPWLQWRNRNIKEYGQCENVIHQLPAEIDVLLLDGGQFSTRAEFHRLKDRTKIVLLDDTQSFKTERAREDMITDPDNWTTIFDDVYDRHGVFMACRNEYVHMLKGV
tara:strand:+ start:3099 stop:3758 length:660 start_codon:yes stop_codon:yes gene_type:complete